jgi:hypothetical protein
MKDINFEKLTKKSSDSDIKNSLEKIGREVIAKALKISSPKTAET